MKNFTLLITLLFAFFITTITTAQISTVKPDRACINCPTDEPDASAVLEIQATDKGILIPRVASVVNMNTSTGLLVYDNSDNTFKYYNGTQWVTFGGNLQTTVLGNGNTASGARSTALGRTNDATGEESLTAGFSNEAIGIESTAIGNLNDAMELQSTALGYANEAIGIGSTAVGDRNDATGTQSTAIGFSNEASTSGSSAVGYGNDATGANATAYGRQNIASGNESFAAGYFNEATERGSTALGNVNDATGIQSTAVGTSNDGTGNQSTVVGYLNEATTFGSTAVGYNNDATGGSATVYGHQNVASGDGSVAIGFYSVAEGNSAIAIGDRDTVNIGGGIAIGSLNKAFGFNSTSIGNRNEASSQNSIAMGYSNTASSVQAIATGYENSASGSRASAFGYQNEVSDDYSGAFGHFNMVMGDSSSAMGYKNQTTGRENTAVGYLNETGGIGSSAVGAENQAIVIGSSAFGYNNQANGSESSAFGYNTSATATGSSAFGQFATASAFNSVAVGQATFASGNFSSAYGNSISAPLFRMTAIGTYNEVPSGSPTTWVATQPVFMVGNGENNGARSTALTILKNGNTGIGTMTPTDAQFIVESEEYDDTIEENIAVFGKSTGTYANIKLLASSRAGIKFIDEGSGVVGESDFMIRMSSAGELEIRNANNADDEFDTSDLVARFETLSDSYQFRVYGDALASGGTWTNSDRRLKKNIKNLDNPLEKIMQLQPKSYNYDHNNAKLSYLNLPEEAQIGLIAQEVEKVLPELVKTDHVKTDFGKDKAPDESAVKEIEDLKAVNYTALIPVLIGAVQEQQNTIESKNEHIEQLEERLNKIEAQLAQISTLHTNKVQLENNTNSEDRASLQQNQPNPFSDQTIIQYFIPETVQQAQLQFHDLNGKVLKVMEIVDKGAGQVELETTSLISGTYSYSLVLDGKIFETKRMVLSR